MTAHQNTTRVEKLFGKRKDKRGIDWNTERVDTLVAKGWTA